MYASVTISPGQTFVYKHVTTSGLTDVVINIFDQNNNQIAANHSMTQLVNGLYLYSFTPTVVGTYTGLMSSATDNSRSVIDLVVTQSVHASTTTISNGIAVGEVNTTVCC